MKINLPRHSTLDLILLTIITGGIYVPIYYIRLDNMTKNISISKNNKFLLKVYLCSAMTQVLLIIMSLYHPISKSIIDPLKYFNLALAIWFAFLFSAVVTIYLKKHRKKIKYNAVWLVILSYLYLQYKINETLRK